MPTTVMLRTMDFIHRHTAPLPRRFATRLPVATVGYLEKTGQDIITHRFKSCNFSFILAGSGFYEKDGRRWPVQAPCVLIQVAEEDQRYGPVSFWHELFLIYEAHCRAQLEACRYLVRERPIWNIGNMVQVHARLEELTDLLRRVNEDGSVDRLDMVCELLIMESILGRARPAESEEEQAIRRIHAYLRGHFLKDHDYDQLAREQGMSRSTFRRRWARMYHEPPGRFVGQLRLREACRLLVESKAPIGDIAERSGFQDQLYFSRIFRKKTGMTASAYRKRHQEHAAFY